MRAGTLLLLFVCGGCHLDLTGLCWGWNEDGCPSPGSGGGGGSGVPRLAFSVQPSGAAEGAWITPAIQVAILDAAGVLIPNASDSITIGISNSPGGGTLSGTTTVAAAGGVATFTNLRIDKRGEGYTLVAGAARYGSDVSWSFSVWCTCWSPRAPMPTPRSRLGVGVVNGVLYAVGGDYIGTVEAYDPVTNSWTTKARMPTPRPELGVGVVNGVLYAVGGDLIGTVEAYDPVANSWSTKAPMPTPRWGFSVGVVSGVLYTVGGDAVGTVEAYDPATNSWTTRAALPTHEHGFGIGVVNGVLYAVGADHDYIGTVEAYDPVTNSWTTKASMPTPRSGVAVGVVTGVSVRRWRNRPVRLAPPGDRGGL